MRINKKVALQVGDVAPDFELMSHRDEKIQLSQFRGKKNIVLYFYPKDDTRHCIVESTEFRDKLNDFKDLNAEIIGISSDSVQSHVEFAQKYQLPFHLLSDSNASVRNQYGVPATLGLIPGRATFVIGKDGIIQHVFNSQFQPRSHVKESLEALQKSK